jgi:hypothetical protein
MEGWYLLGQGAMVVGSPILGGRFSSRRRLILQHIGVPHERVVAPQRQMRQPMVEWPRHRPHGAIVVWAVAGEGCKGVRVTSEFEIC